MAETYSEQPVRRSRPGIAFPLLLVALGVILLLQNLGQLPGNFPDLVWRYWPVLLIVAGLDSIYRNEGVVGALFGIGLGALLLLGNLGYLDINFWSLLVGFWPLLLVGWGLDVLLGRRSPLWLSFLVGLVYAALAIGLILALTQGGLNTRGAPRAEPVNVSLPGTGAGRLVIDGTAGTIRLRAADLTGATLVQGTANLSRTETLDQGTDREDGMDVVRLKSGGTVLVPFAQRSTPNMDLEMTRSRPVALDITLPVGVLDLDLTGAQLRESDLENVIGQTELTLPNQPGLSIELSQVFGRIVLTLPKGAPVRIETDGLSSVSLPAGYTRDGNLITANGGEDADDAINLHVEIVAGSLEVRETP